MSADKICYPIDEGFGVIGLNRTAGYRAIAEGKLRTYKAGRRRFVTKAALEEFVSRMERESQTGRAA